MYSMPRLSFHISSQSTICLAYTININKMYISESLKHKKCELIYDLKIEKALIHQHFFHEITMILLV